MKGTIVSETILYIEDNEANAELVKAIGEGAGYTILIAYDGRDGLEMAQEHCPDLIVCDYHLPYMNGTDVVRALRDNEKTKHLPIMMLTADIYSQPDSMASGADEYLNKPIRRNQFLTRVERLLNPDCVE